MTGATPAKLAELQRLAQLKSDLEMRRFSAFRSRVEGAQAQVRAIEQDLRDIYDSHCNFTIEAARLANALAGERSRALLHAELALQQMLPSFEVARQAALREFGRVEVLRAARQDLIDEQARDQRRKSPFG